MTSAQTTWDCRTKKPKFDLHREPQRRAGFPTRLSPSISDHESSAPTEGGFSNPPLFPFAQRRAAFPTRLSPSIGDHESSAQRRAGFPTRLPWIRETSRASHRNSCEFRSRRLSRVSSFRNTSSTLRARRISKATRALPESPPGRLQNPRTSEQQTVPPVSRPETHPPLSPYHQT